MVEQFWSLFDQRRFAEAGRLMHPDATVWWPNTREVFRGRDRFIRANAEYPGRWRISVERLAALGSGAVSVVRVASVGGAGVHYAVSFFDCRDGFITSITEYWGDCGEPPDWRLHADFAERF